MYTLFRAPCLMEDEGRHQFMGNYENRDTMELAVRSQLGYFSPSNFYYFHNDQKMSDFDNLKPLPKKSSFLEYARAGAPLDF